jgi:hypothetical protein
MGEGVEQRGSPHRLEEAHAPERPTQPSPSAARALVGPLARAGNLPAA